MLNSVLMANRLLQEGRLTVGASLFKLQPAAAYSQFLTRHIVVTCRCCPASVNRTSICTARASCKSCTRCCQRDFLSGGCLRQAIWSMAPGRPPAMTPSVSLGTAHTGSVSCWFSQRFCCHGAALQSHITDRYDAGGGSIAWVGIQPGPPARLTHHLQKSSHSCCRGSPLPCPLQS